MDPAPLPAPLPDLVLWRGDGCHLCDDAFALVTMLLAERAASGLWTPVIIERRIADDPVAERAFIEQIPVLEIDGRRLPLAVRAGPVRAFLADALGDRGVSDPRPEIRAGAGDSAKADDLADAGGRAEARGGPWLDGRRR